MQGYSQPAAPPRAPAARGPVLVLGDSLSAEYGLRRGSGWVELMRERLTRERPGVAVVNASISGETTSGGRTRVADLMARHRPSVVIVELGGNDALRGFDLALTERNLREIVALSRQAGARPLLVGVQVPPNYGRAYTERFAGVFRDVARAEKVPLVPFLLEGFAERLDHFQADRIHPNEIAQPRMLENVWPAVLRLL